MAKATRDRKHAIKATNITEPNNNSMIPSIPTNAQLNIFNQKYKNYETLQMFDLDDLTHLSIVPDHTLINFWIDSSIHSFLYVYVGINLPFEITQGRKGGASW